MNLPRWVVIAMLATSASSVLIASGIWWITWPGRTADRFSELLRDAEVDKINEMIRQPDNDKRYGVWETDVLHFEYRWDSGSGTYVVGVSMPRQLCVERFQNRIVERRSVADLLAARTTFDMGDGWKMTIERNYVSSW